MHGLYPMRSTNLPASTSTISWVTKLTVMRAESRAMSMPSVAANVTNSNGMKLLITA